MRKEKNFVSDIMHSLNQMPGLTAYKIPDAPVFEGQKTRFSPTKPFDIVADYCGKFIAIECKMFKEYKAVSLGLFRRQKEGVIKNCQLTNLLRHECCYVFINIFVPREMNKLIILNRSDIKHIIDGHTIRKKELEEFEYVESKKGIYEVKL